MTAIHPDVCPHHKCKRSLLWVRLGSGLVETALDAEPVPWPVGNIRIITEQPADGNPPIAKRETNASALFGVRRTYRLHKNSCLGGRGSASERARSS